MDKSKRQRRTKGAFALLLILLAIAAPGCSSLDQHVNECFTFDGSPAYTKSGDSVKFSCERHS